MHCYCITIPIIFIYNSITISYVIFSAINNINNVDVTDQAVDVNIIICTIVDTCYYIDVVRLLSY